MVKKSFEALVFYNHGAYPHRMSWKLVCPQGGYSLHSYYAGHSTNSHFEFEFPFRCASMFQVLYYDNMQILWNSGHLITTYRNLTDLSCSIYTWVIDSSMYLSHEWLATNLRSCRVTHESPERLATNLRATCDRHRSDSRVAARKSLGKSFTTVLNRSMRSWNLSISLASGHESSRVFTSNIRPTYEWHTRNLRACRPIPIDLTSYCYLGQFSLVSRSGVRCKQGIIITDGL